MAAKGTPTAIRIGGRTWDIQYLSAERMAGNLGLCRGDDGVLEIRAGQTPFGLRDTVLHEILHAIVYHQGRSGSAPVDEETHARCTATGLMAVLQDNPLFAKWLISSASIEIST